MQRQTIEILDENSALIPHDKKDRHIAKSIAQGTLAIIGLGAGALYFGPSQACVDLEMCGKWLNDLIGRNAAVIVLTAGGLDFSAGAAYMGAESVDATANYLVNQSSLLAKIGKGTFIFIFAVSQNIPLFLTSLGTNPELWQTILTVCGALPGSVYGSIHITEDIIPYYHSVIKKLASNLRHSIFSPLTEAEKQEWKRLDHLRKQHAVFLEQVDARWRYVLEHANSIDTSSYKTKTGSFKESLSFLFSPNLQAAPVSTLAKAVHGFGELSGFLLAVNFSAGGVSNSYHLIKNLIHTPWESLTAAVTGMITMAVSPSMFYGSVRLTVNGMNSMLDVFTDLIEGKSIHSLLYRLRPKTTSLVVAGSLALSALSYAVLAILYIKEFKANDPNNENQVTNAGVYATMAGINIYHFASLFSLYHLMFGLLTKQQKSAFLVEVEKNIEHLKWMTEDQWEKLITQNAEEFAMYGVKASGDLEIVDLEAQNLDDPNAKLLDPELKQQANSRWGRFFNRVFCCAHPETDENVYAAVGEYKALM